MQPVQRAAAMLVAGATMVLCGAAGAALSADLAKSGSCRDLEAAFGRVAVWHCVAAYNNGKSGRSNTSCFTDLDEGFAWVGRRTGRARGTLYAPRCTRPGEVVTYRDYFARGR